jgi:hypothetical protein
MAQELQVQGLMAQALHAGTGLNSTPCLEGSRGQHGSGAPDKGLNLHPSLGSSRGQHGSGATGTGNMVQALHAGTGLNSHSMLGRFQGPAWLRSSRYRAEPTSILQWASMTQEPQVQVMNPACLPTPLGISRGQHGSWAPGTGEEPCLSPHPWEFQGASMAQELQVQVMNPASPHTLGNFKGPARLKSSRDSGWTFIMGTHTSLHPPFSFTMKWLDKGLVILYHRHLARQLQQWQSQQSLHLQIFPISLGMSPARYFSRLQSFFFKGRTL